MKGGHSFTLYQEDWSVKSDYYQETLMTHLPDVVAAAERERAPIRDILEIGIARGSTAIALATLLPEVFTGGNRAYIEQTTGYRFPEMEPGDPFFFITVMQGVKTVEPGT